MTKRQHKKNFYKHIKKVLADEIAELERENKRLSAENEELRVKLKMKPVKSKLQTQANLQEFEN